MFFILMTMPKYIEIVKYVKENHISWDKDVFDILKGFFEEYSSHDYSPPPSLSTPPVQQELIFSSEEFHESADGEYTTQDLIDLFST